jgi:hypothetical protein
MTTILEKFNLKGRMAVITGGWGCSVPNSAGS